MHKFTDNLPDSVTAKSDTDERTSSTPRAARREESEMEPHPRWQTVGDPRASAPKGRAPPLNRTLQQENSNGQHPSRTPDSPKAIRVREDRR
jgi:hypothetical protein